MEIQAIIFDQIPDTTSDSSNKIFTKNPLITSTSPEKMTNLIISVTNLQVIHNNVTLTRM